MKNDTLKKDCENCGREEVDVVASIPFGEIDDLGNTITESLCLACFNEAQSIGAYLSRAYPINIKFITGAFEL